eukprot:CAMPEP_0197620926 /NCGR_PEP_ID=MMETSP1338-20131121/1618_1 /TAXON_ID=43686 ORGANISM="Pelagodinium beii, Strain RCC1491" /NCGR_SAMPLE_ID=MMETSP1338 /ASSEMBLY_ACC=CAM_ASM_000754 /LENGTH=478 /DNA_ID=CAMNT_0043190233 /DNA_START=92 /DNA_END=1528 /DNA_ORIENTATION=-
MKMILGFNLLAVVAIAKKLAQAPTTFSCDYYQYNADYQKSPEPDEPASPMQCPENYWPKEDHHNIQFDTSWDKAKLRDTCCVPTCGTVTCDAGYIKNDAYNSNILDDAANKNQICCDIQCGNNAYDCPEGMKLGDPALPGTTAKECCKGTCGIYDCSGPYTLDVGKKDEVGETHEDCCLKTCKAYPHCERSTGWAHWDEKNESAGLTQEACCVPLCSNTAKITCGAGFFVPKEREDWKNGTKTDNKSKESICCKSTCVAHTCGFGWAENKSLANKWGETDEECCQPTCGNFECDWTKGWASDSSKSTLLLSEVGAKDESCCQPTCKQWECPNNETWMTPTGNYKDNLTKQSNEDCCAKACNQHTCTTGSLVLIPANKVTIGDDDEVCCEPAECPKFRDPVNKTKMGKDKYCNSIEDEEECGKAYSVMEMTQNVTAVNGTTSTVKDLALVSCKFDPEYKLCRVDVSAALKGCRGFKIEE